MAFTKDQIRNQIYNLINTDLALEDALKDCAEKDPMRAQILNERKRIRAGLYYWNDQHRRLTGAPYWQEVGVQVTGQTPDARERAAAANQRATEKSTLSSQAGMLRTHVTNLKEWARSERLKLYNSTFLAVMLPQAGGGSIMNLAQVDVVAIPRAEKAIALAEEKLGRGDLAGARVQLAVAAQWLEAGGARLDDYRNSIQEGGKNVITTIKVSSAAATGVGGAAVGTLKFVPAVGVEMLGAAAGEATTLTARVLSGEKISGKDIGDALLNVAIAGGSASAGEAGKAIFGPLVVKLLGGGGNREAIEAAVGNYFAANSKQLADYVQKVNNGEKPNYDYLAGLLAPVVQVAGKSGAAGAKILEEKDLRKSVADRLKENVPATAGRP